MVRQCELASVSRATVYAQKAPSPMDPSDRRYSQLIDEEYTRHPFYGTRRMVIFLGKAGHLVNLACRCQVMLFVFVVESLNLPQT